MVGPSAICKLEFPGKTTFHGPTSVLDLARCNSAHRCPVNSEKVSAHLLVDRYGDFRLTEAIRPSLDLQVVPRQGYRRDTFRDPDSRLEVPVLAAAVSAENLFPLFLELLQPLGEVVDVIVESSHDTAGG